MTAVVVLPFALGGLACRGAHADDNSYYKEKAQGWFWYQKTPEPVKPKPKAPLPPSAPVKSAPPKHVAPPKLSADWLRKNLPRLRDEAIDNPDNKEKVAAYMYAQRVLLDKAQRFAEAAASLSSTDPLLDESTRIPADYLAAASFERGITDNQVKALKYLSGKAGLFFFFDSRCDFCQLEVKSVKWLADKYGFLVKNISVDGKPMPGMNDWARDQGQAAALNLRIFPTTVMVVPPNNYYVISQGFQSAESLGKKIMTVAIGSKLLPENMLSVAQSYDRGVLTAKDMRDPAITGDPGSPEWVHAVRSRLGHRY